MTPEVEFTPWPKIYRLFDSRHGWSVTEKADGSNAAIQVRDGQVVGVQSRKRLITVDSDNFGFARWVKENEALLAEVLGDGVHFGEWYGSGIQRGYGLVNGDKRFALFNAVRWRDAETGLYPEEFDQVQGLEVVPELYRGPIDLVGVDRAVLDAVDYLRDHGSQLVPGYDRPEGVVAFHIEARTAFKYIPKGWEPGSKKASRG